MTRHWVDGVETVLTEDEWARRAAAFLGCGFRVVVPSGPVRSDALAMARQQAVRVADLFGAPLDEAPWQAAAASEGAVEIVGGWRHQFREPAGDQTTMITDLPRPVQPSRAARGVRLPWALNAHSPLAGLPMISRLEDSQALRALEAATVGLWWNTDGHLVSSTAGPLLLRMDDGWVCPPLGGGAVPHFVWARLTELLEVRELLVDDEVVTTASEALYAVDAQGSVTFVDSVTGSTYQPRVQSSAELVVVVEAVLLGT